MKKSLFVLMFLVFGFSFGYDTTGVNAYIDSVADTTDELFSFTFKTKYRSDFNVQTFNKNLRVDFSRCTWIFNKTKKCGLWLDETEEITSFYRILSFDINDTTINGITRTTIKGEVRSLAGNKYNFIINDYADVMVLTGYNMNNVVIRRFYDLQDE
jgi:hypothetical protein